MTNEERSQIQDNIVDSLPDPAHGILLLAPRVGKTRIAVNNIKKEKPKSILYVTPTTKLRDEDIPNEFILWKAKRYLSKTKIICYSSLSNEEGHYDKIYLDEYQDLTPGNAQKLLDGRLTYGSILCLSGTAPEHKEKHEIYDALKLKPLANLDIDEAVGRGIIADYKLHIVEVTMEDKKKLYQSGSKANPFMQTEKARYEYISRMADRLMFAGSPSAKWKILERMRLIYDSKSKEVAIKWLMENLEGRKMIFTGGIDQAERVSKYTFHSKTTLDDMHKFIEGSIDEIACVNAGGIGYTYRNVNHFIIGKADSDKKGLTTQKICRSLLEQGDDYTAQIWMVKLLDTKDVVWVDKVLKKFDSSKIIIHRFDNLKNGSEQL